MAEMFFTQDGGASVSAVGRACAYTVCSVGSDLAPSQTGPHVQRNSLTPALFFRGAKPRDFGDWSALGQWAHSVMTVALTRQSPMLGWYSAAAAVGGSCREPGSPWRAQQSGVSGDHLQFTNLSSLLPIQKGYYCSIGTGFQVPQGRCHH